MACCPHRGSIAPSFFPPLLLLLRRAGLFIVRGSETFKTSKEPRREGGREGGRKGGREA